MVCRRSSRMIFCIIPFIHAKDVKSETSHPLTFLFFWNGKITRTWVFHIVDCFWHLHSFCAKLSPAEWIFLLRWCFAIPPYCYMVLPEETSTIETLLHSTSVFLSFSCVSKDEFDKNIFFHNFINPWLPFQVCHHYTKIQLFPKFWTIILFKMYSLQLFCIHFLGSSCNLSKSSWSSLHLLWNTSNFCH